MPYEPTGEHSHSKNPYKQSHTQAAKGTTSGDSEMVEEPQISWSEIDKLEAQARKEKEQDEPILVSNARRASDAIKERQKTL